MIRTLALLFIGLWVVTAVVAEENPIFPKEDLIIMEDSSENVPTLEHVAEGQSTPIAIIIFTICPHVRDTNRPARRTWFPLSAKKSPPRPDTNGLKTVRKSALRLQPRL